jgi:hydroxyethylthiazole kinase-like uncharacterized protein yjeF
MGAKITTLSKQIIKELLPKRMPISHKGTYGNILNIAGSATYPGAALLSSVAALRAGAGYVMLATVSSAIPIVAANSPDITFLDLGEANSGMVPKDALKHIEAVSNPHCFSLGCGLGISRDSRDFVTSFLNKYSKSPTPIIIDADGINILAQMKRPVIPLNSIITPHPLELGRLLGVDAAEIQAGRTRWAWEASKKFDCIVLLKGHDTVIAVPNGQIFINTTGNSALAKAGAGDVLTGMLAGFCAQGTNLENAACLAVYLHGLAGELASKVHTEYSVLASNLVNYIPPAIKEVL